MTPEDVVKRYGGRYRGNRGGWLCQCMYPDHEDSTPSFSVNVEGLFYCWGCRKKGNFARLLHDIVGWSWPKSISHADVTLKHQGFLRSQSQTQWLFEEQVVNGYSNGMLGLFDCDWEEGWYRYQQAVEEEDAHRPPWAFPFEKGFTYHTLAEFQAGYDSDLQRITIPVFAERNKLVGLIGRTCVYHDIKYYIYPGTFPSKHVYNLWTHPSIPSRQDFILLVEGPWDVWWIHQTTGLWAVALMTTHMSAEQMYQLCRRSQKFILMFDNDPPGRKGAFETAQALLAMSATIDIAVSPHADVKKLTQQQIEEAIKQRKPFPAPSALEAFDGETFKTRRLLESRTKGRT